MTEQERERETLPPGATNPDIAAQVIAGLLASHEERQERRLEAFLEAQAKREEKLLEMVARIANESLVSREELRVTRETADKALVLAQENQLKIQEVQQQQANCKCGAA